MKRTFLIIAAALAFQAKADTDYVGIHVTVPFTFDGVGVQVVGRYGYGELRGGIDSRRAYQFGGGATTGDNLVSSIGVAYSSDHHYMVPYGAVAYGRGSYEVGAVSYNLDEYTSYVVAGVRAGREDNDSTGNAQAPAAAGGGTDTGGGSGNDGAPGRRVTAPDSPVVSPSAPDWSDIGGGNEHGQGGSNRSGLGDGTNPGKGGGRDNSPNKGTNNPHRGK